MLLASLAKQLKEFIEAMGFFIERIAGYLDELWKVLVWNVANENLALLTKSCYNWSSKAERRGWQRFKHLLLVFLESFQKPQYGLLISPLEAYESFLREVLERYDVIID